VPPTTADRDKTSMQGWSDYVKDKYDRKVGSGFHHYTMFKTRVAFKYALRYCHSHSEQLTADAGATDLLDTHNPNKFWKGILRETNGRSAKYATEVNDASGDTDVCMMYEK